MACVVSSARVMGNAGVAGQEALIGSDHGCGSGNEQFVVVYEARAAGRHWETEAVPTHMRRAREQAARLLEPKAVRVRPKSTTLHTVDELETYLTELRNEILQYIDAENSVLI
jgi:hypothetical protein